MTNYKVYSDTDFTSADTNFIIDLESDIGIAAKDFIAVIGFGKIGFELSYDGTNFGDVFELNADKKLSIEGLKAKKVRLTHIGIDSSFVVIALPLGESFDINTISELIAFESPVTSSITANTSNAVTLLAANNKRRGFVISSKDVVNFWIRLQPAATNPTAKEGIFIDNTEIDPWEWTNCKYVYTGEVSVIAENNSPTIHVVEF